MGLMNSSKNKLNSLKKLSFSANVKCNLNVFWCGLCDSFFVFAMLEFIQRRPSNMLVFDKHVFNLGFPPSLLNIA